ncbi:S41 family peptidase [Roseibacillus persicicus]|uniref:Tricorn protease homolog n=1 Tax=Roseibacillus persicicus TaxID=454148 RepID=A0A918TE67_9BACT|nr:S41 family peptidase [Roseibacillus persicicus]GHC41990.1 tricorn protease [Roseibacillus persicicus]
MKTLTTFLFLCSLLPVLAEDLLGYYRQPALHNDTVVFQAEGDLWKVPAVGGQAHRLTTHLKTESRPRISPNGQMVAFAASYEGPVEIYQMPLAGGRPQRLTYEGVSGGRSPFPVAWKDEKTLLYATWFFSRRDTFQIVELNIETGEKTILPLEQASDGRYSDDGQSFFFTRLPRQRSFAKRYTGGFIEKIWRYDTGAPAAVPLTADYEGTSRSPMVWQDRLYFVSDRDGTMNIWSSDLLGKDLKQHTSVSGWDILDAYLDKGRIIYRNQADLWIYSIAEDAAKMVPIRLASDFDQKRRRWIDKPARFLSQFALSPKGDKLAVTVRGQGFVAPVKGGRLAAIPQTAKSRVRDVQFFSEGERVLLLSDETGEFEFATQAIDGSDERHLVTEDSTTRLYPGILSPDGARLAYADRDQRLFVLELETGQKKEVIQARDPNDFDRIDLAWSPDSRWIAFSAKEENSIYRVYLFNTLEDGEPVAVTTDRMDSYSPAWSSDGQWLYFLSDRTFRSVQRSPWGPRQPEAYLDRTASIFLLDLVGGQASPFQSTPRDPLSSLPKDPSKDDKKSEEKEEEDGAEEREKEEKKQMKAVEISWDGLQGRLHRVPLEAGNYSGLTVTKKHLYFFHRPLGFDSDRELAAFPILDETHERRRRTIASDVREYQLSADHSHCAVRKKDTVSVFPANGKAPENLSKYEVDLSAIGIRISPAEEWEHLFLDAWRLHRDYFYDPDMHGVDWVAQRKKHEVLLPRITARKELDDLIGQMVGELSAMHTDIRPGEIRDAKDGRGRGYLGGRFTRVAEGYQIASIYQGEPDLIESLSPLAQPGLDIAAGDIITRVNGREALTEPDLGVLLENTSSRKVLLELQRPGRAERHLATVVPIDLRGFISLKLTDWEYTRRMETERQGEGELGYFHMRAMGGGNFSEFVRGYYPVSNRKGLIIDMRQNYGGNIDSWILARLIRQRWMYWQGRTGEAFPNMPYAFNGHMAVLIDGYTISDGEAFSEGFRRLGLGPLIGSRTWGGGIWLRGHTYLKDGGLARSPETGVFTEDGWVIEGSGVDPDISVMNEPHASYQGQDAQLEAAIAYLQEKIASDPPQTPQAPPRPNKAFVYPDEKK